VRVCQFRLTGVGNSIGNRDSLHSSLARQTIDGRGKKKSTTPASISVILCAKPVREGRHRPPSSLQDNMKQSARIMVILLLAVMTYRTKRFDAALLDALQNGARQVVVLGAGFDSRAYRFQSQLRGVRFMEVDYGPTQAYKKQRLGEILELIPSNVSFVPMDFT